MIAPAWPPRETPRRRRTASLRRLFLLLLGGVLGYVVLVALYMALRVAPAVADLRRESEPMLQLFSQITSRARALRTASLEIHRVATASRPPRLDELERLRGTVLVHEGRITPAPLARIPAAMRVPLARADEQASRLQNALTEVIAALEIGRRERLDRQLYVVDSLEHDVTQHLADAQRIGLEDLRTRERELEAVSREAVTIMAGWLGLGALMLVLLFVVVLRRLAEPLDALEHGLTRVADGDLSARVPVQRDDELGQLAAHFNDMTRVLRLRAEEQGRFSAAGQLIAGVAHEVNNPLMAIAALADTRLEDADLAPEVRADWLQVKRQARRAGKLLSGLLRFVRPTGVQVHGIPLNAVVRDAIELVAYRFPVDEITLDERLDPAGPLVSGDAGRFEQVLVNLFSNAIDAMLEVAPPRRLVVESWQTDGRVHVAVADNGPGVASTVAGRLFHPFVSTKGARGTGLGLYISRQIMREAGGDLVAETSHGQGARFVAYLPAAVSASTLAPIVGAEIPPPPSPRPGLGGLRILVTDDEPAVRNPIARYLARHGAVVHQAGDGQEALDLLALHEVDVVLADLRMPVMDGAELYARLAAERPGIAARLVFLSGDISLLAARGGLPVPEDRVLVKPVDLREIEAKVLEVHRAGGMAGSSEIPIL